MSDSGPYLSITLNKAILDLNQPTLTIPSPLLFSQGVGKEVLWNRQEGSLFKPRSLSGARDLLLPPPQVHVHPEFRKASFWFVDQPALHPLRLSLERHWGRKSQYTCPQFHSLLLQRNSERRAGPSRWSSTNMLIQSIPCQVQWPCGLWWHG